MLHVCEISLNRQHIITNTYSSGQKSQEGYNVGIYFPKGCFIYFKNGLYISKDGIAMYANNGSYLKSRMCALIESLLFIILIPIMLITYLMLLIIFILLLILITLFGCFMRINFTFLGITISGQITFIKILLKLIIGCFLSIILIFIYLLIIPFNILTPELTTALEQNIWVVSNNLTEFLPPPEFIV